MAAIRRSRQEWKTILADFEASGQTAQQFCAERGLNAGYFSKQRVRLRKPAFVAVETPVLQPPAATVTVKVGRYVVECGADAPATWIADLVTQLRR